MNGDISFKYFSVFNNIDLTEELAYDPIKTYHKGFKKQELNPFLSSVRQFLLHLES
jgi:hypothetical protein